MIWVIHFLVTNILLLIAKKKKENRIFVYGTFLYVIFIFGQRWMTGEDFPNYLNYYILNFRGKEFLYFEFQNIFVKYKLSFSLFIFIIFFVTTFNFYRLMLKFNKNILVMIYIYLFTELFFIQMTQIRQLIAVSFFVNGYFFFINKSRVKGIIYIIIAYLFHASTLLVVPFLFFSFKFDKKILLLLVTFCFLLPLVDIRFLLKLEVINIYIHYLGTQFDTTLSIFHYFRFYIIVAITIIYLYNIKINFNNTNEKIIINGVFVYIILYGLGFKFALIFRVANYFKIFETIFLAYYINDLRNFSQALVERTVIFVILVFYLGIALIDPYTITCYQFRHIELFEEMNSTQLRREINNFYINR